MMQEILYKETPTLHRNGKSPKEQITYLQKQHHMEDVYLGACLESCGWGGEISIMYEMNTEEMKDFIQNWMQQNKKHLDMLWLTPRMHSFFEHLALPYINHDSCPLGEHEGIIKDHAGRERCGYQSRKEGLLDVCYEVISEKNTILPLEMVIDRLKLKSKGSVYKDYLQFPFDGWTLAAYAKKWHEQGALIRTSI